MNGIHSPPQPVAVGGEGRENAKPDDTGGSMKKAWKSFLMIVVLGSAVGVASTVSAQVADHLKCYKVKDLRGQTNDQYT